MVLCPRLLRQEFNFSNCRKRDPRTSGGVGGRGREASSYPDWAPQGGAYGIDNV
jgi:hypothetical protein